MFAARSLFTHVIRWPVVQELRLAQQLMVFPETIESMLGDLQPRNICSYLYETCGVFTEFYTDCYCVQKDKETKKIVNVVRIHRRSSGASMISHRAPVRAFSPDDPPSH